MPFAAPFHLAPWCKSHHKPHRPPQCGTLLRCLTQCVYISNKPQVMLMEGLP
jgi:hypothetical protein